MSLASYEYPELRRVCYGDEGATFLPVCLTCGRFVKADDTAIFDGHGQPKEPNATCKKHGRVLMPFEGYV